MSDNILINDFNTPFNVAPFSKIKDEDYLPAFKIAIKAAKEEIDTITPRHTYFRKYY